MFIRIDYQPSMHETAEKVHCDCSLTTLSIPRAWVMPSRRLKGLVATQYRSIIGVGAVCGVIGVRMVAVVVEHDIASWVDARWNAGEEGIGACV